MAHIVLKKDQIIGTIKPMHAVNNGPTVARADQTRGNFDTFKAAKIPFARNHDASHCSAYGGPHTVDVNCIFTNFDADENDPASYDFVLTDQYLENTLKAGTQIFYRLGASIEHWIKKYNTLPPKDFHKWARICEHIIAHYNEGWADGFRWNIEYWEIWNEPDLDPDDSPNKRCWGGTEAQFHELYRIAARHLKNRFPTLKIGGPAIAGNMAWGERFITAMAKDNVPMDFFSWHRYTVDPYQIAERQKLVREMLDKNGYTETESILNEYNYVRGWGADWIYSLEQMTGLKGAAFTAGCFCTGQNSGLDMLMYYDARVGCGMNGMFHQLTLRPIKGYYVFTAFSELYELKNHVECSCDDPLVYVTAAANGDEARILVSNYKEDDSTPATEITVSGLKNPEVVLTDAGHDGEEIPVKLDKNGNLKLTLERNAFALIRSK